MKKVLMLVLPVLAAALVIPAAFAGNVSANKTTGTVSYNNPWTGDATTISFVAQDLGSNGAKGNMSYTDSTGRSYAGTVITAHVTDAKHASFTVKVTSSTFDNTPVGTLVPLDVVDNGEPGVNDTIGWMGYNLGPLTGGNIQVQFNG